MTSWPELQYESWKDTYTTLHRWLQMVGKAKTYYCPWINHSWNSALYISSRGFTTGAIPLRDRNVTIEMDLIAHELTIKDSTDHSETMKLQSESVASFYRRFCQLLRSFNIEPAFSKTPNEVMDAEAFDKDEKHCTYRPDEARRCFEVLVLVSNCMQEFRTHFEGKSSPVHFFWGSFDLALTFFSGRKAPSHPGGIPHLPDNITRESYSHEVMSFGFWPGNEMYPRPAFYAYAYPEPESLKHSTLQPQGAYYHPELREFLLDYDKVRSSSGPEKLVKDFFRSAFEVISQQAEWDEEVLAIHPLLEQFAHKTEEHRLRS